MRRTGIARDEEEHSQGISAVGSAFRDQTGTIYAISIPVPTAATEPITTTIAPLLLKYPRPAEGNTRDATGVPRREAGLSRKRCLCAGTD